LICPIRQSYCSAELLTDKDKSDAALRPPATLNWVYKEEVRSSRRPEQRMPEYYLLSESGSRIASVQLISRTFTNVKYINA
jgi:hypothetical protein